MSKKSSKKNYYAVKKGRKTGIFETWTDCEAQVSGFPGAIYKGFVLEEDAKAFLAEDDEPIKKIKEYFEEISESDDDEMKEISLLEKNKDIAFAFVDGSFVDETYSCGVDLFFNGEEYAFSEIGKDDTSTSRNVAGEILGAIRAIEKAIALNAKEIVVYHDYMGISAWANDEWKANKGLTLNYKNFIKENKEKIKINFVKIKGHSGIFLNEKADNLAYSILVK